MLYDITDVAVSIHFKRMEKFLSFFHKNKLHIYYLVLLHIRYNGNAARQTSRLFYLSLVIFFSGSVENIFFSCACLYSCWQRNILLVSLTFPKAKSKTRFFSRRKKALIILLHQKYICHVIALLPFHSAYNNKIH